MYCCYSEGLVLRKMPLFSLGSRGGGRIVRSGGAGDTPSSMKTWLAWTQWTSQESWHLTSRGTGTRSSRKLGDSKYWLIYIHVPNISNNTIFNCWLLSVYNTYTVVTTWYNFPGSGSYTMGGYKGVSVHTNVVTSHLYCCLIVVYYPTRMCKG